MTRLEVDELLRILSDSFDFGRPVVLPDFFVDHFVVYPSYSEFIEGLNRLAAQGGGNLMETEQFIRRGGNAVNTASALLALGVSPHLIVKTSRWGKVLMKTLVHPDLELGHVHTGGRLSHTVSIETTHNQRNVNLMVSDSGAAADFRFSDLTSEDLECIFTSPLVALVCLNHNRRAPDLAEELYSAIREHSDALTFMDMGDPSSNPSIVEPLVERVLLKGLVDVLSANENEICYFADNLPSSDLDWMNAKNDQSKWLKAARLVASECGVRVDLHTPYYSASVTPSSEISVPAFEVKSQVSCGAGDAWNAGSIVGTLLGLDPKRRLLLANSVAALYVKSPTTEHPLLSDVISFLQNPPPMQEPIRKAT
ncbi:MAG: carbohydrate kinase family protein [Candidatus Thorarchaeota archaeon]|nr:carbohydrate kinase family protein [Candidatus Thorarchaeota archaeon]